MSNRLLTSHLAEANDKDAEILNLGLFVSDTEIESKTAKGRLRTIIDNTATENNQTTHQWYGDNVEMKLEQFNDCPGKELIQKQLDKLGINDYVEIADAPEQYWQNKSDTLVLKIKQIGITPTFATGLAFTELITKTKPDEFSSQVFNYATYIRMWWD